MGTVTNITGHCGNTFDATRTWQATDACTTNKIIQLGNAWSFDLPTVTDNGGSNFTLAEVGTVTNITGHCGNTFDAPRTSQATDACGNSAQCSQTVTVIDTTVPVIACS